MKKTIFAAKLMNPYRSQTPRGYYDKLKGHTGEDRQFAVGDTLLAPVSGKVVKCSIQTEMGKVLYLLHEATGDIWVFAHNSAFLRGVGDSVQRGDALVTTGNTGSKTTAPHSHVEVITPHPITDPKEGGMELNKIMTRTLNGFKGWNVCPSDRLKALYAKYGIDLTTGVQKAPVEIPHNPNGF